MIPLPQDLKKKNTAKTDRHIFATHDWSFIRVRLSCYASR